MGYIIKAGILQHWYMCIRYSLKVLLAINTLDKNYNREWGYAWGKLSIDANRLLMFKNLTAGLTYWAP